MTVTVPTWLVVVLIYAAFLAFCWWIDRWFLQPWADRLMQRLVDHRARRRARAAALDPSGAAEGAGR